MKRKLLRLRLWFRYNSGYLLDLVLIAALFYIGGYAVGTYQGVKLTMTTVETNYSCVLK